MNRNHRSARRSLRTALLIASWISIAPASSLALSFSGIDAQTQFGFANPNLLTFNDTVNGTNPNPEPGTVTGTMGVGGVLGGRITLELLLDTSGYNKATDPGTGANFIGTGGNEVMVWNATMTTLLLSFDVFFVDVSAMNGLGISNQVELGDAEGSSVQSHSFMKVAGGSLAGTVGGVGTVALLDLIINDPDPPLSDTFGDFLAGYPGFWNNDFTSGIAPPLTGEAGTNWAITILPEPGTGILLGAGLAALAAYRRRRAH